MKKLVILGTIVALSPQIKIVGVVLDQKFNYKTHVAWAFQKRINLVLALKRLKNLCLEMAYRQFQIKIVPVIDYASLIWSLCLLMVLVNKLNMSQRIESQAVIKVFYIVGSIIREFKAGLELPIIYYHKEQL